MSVNPATAESILARYPNFKCVEPVDACLLGSPIGCEQSINNVLSFKLGSMEVMAEQLSLLHSQDALCLLQNVFSLPKVLYVLRTAPCFHSRGFAKLDSLQRSLLESICNIHLSDDAWIQASLPTKAGGGGRGGGGGLWDQELYHVCTFSLPSVYHWCSCISQKILPMSAQNSLHPLKADAMTIWSLGHSSDPSSDPDSSKQQASDAPRVKATFAKLPEGSTPHAGHRPFVSSGEKGTGAWLTTHLCLAWVHAWKMTLYKLVWDYAWALHCAVHTNVRYVATRSMTRVPMAYTVTKNGCSSSPCSSE